LVAGQRSRRGLLRIVQRIAQRQRAGQLLVDDIGAEVEARFHRRAKAIAKIGVELLVLAALMRAEAVRVVDAQVGQEVEGADLARDLAAGARGAKAAA